MKAKPEGEFPLLSPLILLTGATGYVGGRLLRILEREGYRIRCIARHPEYLKDKVSAATDISQGDVMDRASLERAMVGVTIAYYLVHSMGSSGSFEEQDRLGAQNFSEAASAAGVQRIIYLGGLGDESHELSPHLRSRQEVGKILRNSGIPVVEFRASIVIGAGSLSFEMIRSLVERLPLMVIPKWAAMPAQPIAIDDLLSYLIAGLEIPALKSQVYEIGGSDIVSYADIMKAYARKRGVKLRMISVPVLTPSLSSLWLALITPLYARIGRKLIQSIVHSTIVHDTSAIEIFNIHPVGIEAALEGAIQSEEKDFAATRWSSALSSTGVHRSWGGVRFGSRLVDSRIAKLPISAPEAFKPIERIGGKTGWYAWNRLWQIRGFLDSLIGGVGLRRGRLSSERIQVGDTLDFWRVEAIEQNSLLRLSAEMKLPGRAWLEFEVTGNDKNSTIRQTATFDPLGIIGLAYWYALYPIHQFVFQGMLDGIVNAALKSEDVKKK
ncbi:MAG: SDR family oxidoreductase [bacterium]